MIHTHPLQLAKGTGSSQFSHTHDHHGGDRLHEHATDSSGRPTGEPEFMDRHPNEILADFDAGCRGLADIDMRAVLWEVINDVCSSYRLAMEGAMFDSKRVSEVQNVVLSYVINTYGDN